MLHSVSNHLRCSSVMSFRKKIHKVRLEYILHRLFFTLQYLTHISQRTVDMLAIVNEQKTLLKRHTAIKLPNGYKNRFRGCKQTQDIMLHSKDHCKNVLCKTGWRMKVWNRQIFRNLGMVFSCNIHDNIIVLLFKKYKSPEMKNTCPSI